MIIWLRISGITLNALGAIILAVRVKKILDIMVLAHKATDLNMRQTESLLSGKIGSVEYVFGMDEQVERQQKSGVWQLVIGFAFIAVGNFLVALSWYFEI